MRTIIKTEKFGAQRYFLLWALLSFLGWAFETLFVFVAFGKWHNQGFLTLPFCPIYASSLMTTYWLAGTPDEPRGALKNVENKLARYGLYLLIAFLVPSVAEWIVGFVLDKGLHLWLWNYEGFALNLMGYVCVPVSLVWMALIFLFMKWVFPWLKRAVGKLSSVLSWVAAAAVGVMLGVDLAYNLLQRLL